MKKVPIIFISLFLLFLSCSKNDSIFTDHEKKAEQLTKQKDQKYSRGLYQLQGVCREYANEWFDQTIIGKTENVSYNYVSHYNRKLNHCFVMLETTKFPQEKIDTILITKDLYDINENKSYAHAIFEGKSNKPKDEYLYRSKDNEVVCTVLDIKCRSKVEWDSLVKQYMEE
jgi:hypothetical protein